MTNLQVRLYVLNQYSKEQTNTQWRYTETLNQDQLDILNVFIQRTITFCLLKQRLIVTAHLFCVVKYFVSIARVLMRYFLQLHS